MNTSEKHPGIVKTQNIYFQIGLVISLFLTYYFIELEVPQNQEGVFKEEIREIPSEVFNHKIKIIKEPIAESKPEIKKPKEAQKLKVSQTETEPDTEPTQDKNPEPNPIDEYNPELFDNLDLNIEKVAPDFSKTFNTWELDERPSFPACVGLKGVEAKKCFHVQLQKFLKRNMRYPEKAFSSGNEGTVMVNFVIDKQGKVSAVIPAHTKGKVSKELEQEAIRLIRILPRMIPGKHATKPVDVSFSIPISFKIK